jgi:hypothetical protein
MSKKRKKKEELILDNRKNIKIKERQIKWIIIFVIGVILLFIATYWVIKWHNYSNSYVDYIGVRWYKTGTKEFPSFRGEFNLPKIKNFGLYLKSDPRKNNVTLNVDNWGFYPKVLISYDSKSKECYGGILAQINLVYFISGGLKLTPGAAMFNKTEASEKNITFANCSSAINKTVILIQKSEVPSVEQDINNPDCYIINVGQCESLLATEKFMLGIIATVNNKTLIN